MRMSENLSNYGEYIACNCDVVEIQNFKSFLIKYKINEYDVTEMQTCKCDSQIEM